MRNGRIRTIVGMGIFSILLLGFSLFARADSSVFFESASYYLTQQDIEGMTPQMLNYARNEIFAKHGRIFRSRELRDYFGTKTWYRPTVQPDDFQSSWLNAYETANVQFLLKAEQKLQPGGYQLDQPGYDISWADYPNEIVPVTAISVPDEKIRQMLAGNIVELGNMFTLDADGDGTEEFVSLELEENIMEWGGFVHGDSAVLHVGEGVFYQREDAIRDTVYGVSLDGRELLLIVFADGPSNDPVAWFLRYEDAALHNIGVIEDDVDQLLIMDGIIYGKIRNNLIGTLAISVSWTMNAYGYLEQIPQDMYSFWYWDDGWRGTRLKNVTYLYSGPDYGSSQIMMWPEEVRFTLTDGDCCVYVEGRSGAGGWFDAGDYEYSEKDEVFEKLQWAD